jgi:hypothetical protein
VCPRRRHTNYFAAGRALPATPLRLIEKEVAERNLAAGAKRRPARKVAENCEIFSELLSGRG